MGTQLAESCGVTEKREGVREGERREREDGAKGWSVCERAK